MTPDYSRLLDAALGASIRVEFGTDRRAVTNYSVVLVVDEGAGPQTVRVYDGTHGVNEMHRYTPAGGKQPARSSTPVPLVRECVRQCARSRLPTKR
jgi:hypothetical protein